MKKRILTALLALLLVASLGVGAFAAVRLGDVDGDGKITAFDAQMIAEHKAGDRDLSAQQLEAAGDLSVQDVVDMVLTDASNGVYPVAGQITETPPAVDD